MEDGGGAIEWNWFAESTSLSSVAEVGGIGRGIGRGFGRIVCDTISGSRSRQLGCIFRSRILATCRQYESGQNKERQYQTHSVTTWGFPCNNEIKSTAIGRKQFVEISQL